MMPAISPRAWATPARLFMACSAWRNTCTRWTKTLSSINGSSRKRAGDSIGFSRRVLATDSAIKVQLAAVGAIAARVLKESDARLAAYSLKLAQADWHFACAGMSETNATNSKELWRGTFDSDNVEHEAASVGVLASVDLWRVTGNQQYADKAVELARIILDSQQRK